MKKKKSKLWLHDLMLCFAMLGVFLIAGVVVYTNSYFTSTSKKSGDLNFANIDLVIDSTNKNDALFSSYLPDIIPGDKLTFENISVTNSGNTDIYTVLNLNIYTTRTGYTDYQIDKWYNLYGEEINPKQMENNTVEATKVLIGDSQDLTELSYDFDGNIYDNTFKGSQTLVTLRAVAVQADNLQPIENVEQEELIATKMLMNDFYVEKPSNIANMTQLKDETVASITCSIPSETMVDSSVQYSVYNVGLENANAGDTVYVQAKGADQIFIAPGTHNLEKLLYDYTVNGTFPDGTIQAYGQALTSFTIEGGEIVPVRAMKTSARATVFDGKFTIVSVGSSNVEPTIRVYTTPKEDLPTIENDLGVYLVDYEDIKTGSILQDVPVETMPNIDGNTYFDIYNFKVENVTENSTVYIYATDALMQIIGYENMAMADALGYISQQQLPPNSVVRGYLSGSGQPCVYSFNLTAGEEFKFNVVQMTGYGYNNPQVHVYCTPQGGLPGYSNDLAYMLLEDGSGYSAFAAHDFVVEANIPDYFNGLPVKEVMDNGFDSSQFLSSVSIGKNVEMLNYFAFGDCTNLNLVTFAEDSKLKLIGKASFYCCTSLTSITIPSSVVTIEAYAFECCENLSSVNFMENSQLITIGDGAFLECFNLTYITIPNGVETIEDHAFSNCESLESINIPSSVTTIGFNSFRRCDKLEVVTLLEKENYCWAIYDNLNKLVAFDANKLSQVELLVYLKNEDWHVSYKLKNITNNSDKLFYELSADSTYYSVVGVKDVSITQVVIPEMYNNKPVKKILGQYRTGAHKFYKCTNLQCVVIPKTVEEIGYYAFQSCENLEQVIFDEDSALRKIEYNAFANCKQLSSIIIPHGVEIIDNDVFLNCVNLTTVEIPNTINLMCGSFTGCSKLKNVTLNTREGYVWALTDERSYMGQIVVPDAKELSDKGLINALQSISVCFQVIIVVELDCVYYASYDDGETYLVMGVSDKSLTTYNLVSTINGKHVLGIGGFAFGGCGLTTLIVPESFEIIGFRAFGYSSNLTTLTLQAKEGYVWAVYSGDVKVVPDVSKLTQEELIEYVMGGYQLKQIKK